MKFFINYALFTVTVLLLLAGCEKKIENQFIGRWVIQEDSNEGVEIIFKEDRSYDINFKRGDTFTGYFSIKKNSIITFVDNYCGTKLPGDYKFVIQNKSLDLKVISDQFCGRRDFFPTVWIKKENKDVAL